MGSTNLGPLTAVLIDPSDSDHVKELTIQRIACGWPVDKVLDMMEEVRNGQRKHYLYYETATMSPVGSGAITSIAHTATLEGMEYYALPSDVVTLGAGFIYSHHRGKNYANISHSHRQEVSFSNPKINKIIIDTAAHFTDVLAWHKRMGYEQIGELDEINDGAIRFVFAEITRERWMEYKAKERAKVAAHDKDGKGLPTDSYSRPPFYDEKEARDIFDQLNLGTKGCIPSTVLPVAAEEKDIEVQA